jgi:hypothetical protein
VGTVNVGSRAPAKPLFYMALREGGSTVINGRRPRSRRVSDRDSATGFDSEIIPGDHIPTGSPSARAPDPSPHALRRRAPPGPLHPCLPRHHRFQAVQPRLGRQLHAHFVASPYSGDDIVKSSLINMYRKCGVPDDARKVFDSIGIKNSIVWIALVSGACLGAASSRGRLSSLGL